MPLIKTINKFKNKKLHTPNHKIFFSVSSEGFGHSSRILAIAREFSHDEMLIGSYNYAYDKIKSMGLPCIELNQELKLIGQGGAFDVGKTIIKNRVWALNFNKLVNDEMEIIRASGASCVVADGRLVPVIAAEKLSLPCIVITNQSAFYPFFAKDSALIRVFGKSFDWIMKTWLISTEEIMIPDFPPPYSVCLPNLSHNYKVMKRTRFVGPMVYWDNREIKPMPKPSAYKPYIVVTLGGHSYRRPIFDNMIKVARKMPNVMFDIFTSFTVEDVPDNVRLMGMVPNIVEYMKAADIVITQAGHSTAMELLTMGKQSIIIPDLNQTEQENNARRMSELGVAETIVYNNLSCDRLIEVISNMLGETRYTEKAKYFLQMAEVIQGRKRAAKILRDYSTRLQCY